MTSDRKARGAAEDAFNELVEKIRLVAAAMYAGWALNEAGAVGGAKVLHEAIADARGPIMDALRPEPDSKSGPTPLRSRGLPR